MTIDSISHGRFGVNLVTGWQKAEYDQMGLWPGEQHYTDRYNYLAEYAQVLRELHDKAGMTAVASALFNLDAALTR